MRLERAQDWLRGLRRPDSAAALAPLATAALALTLATQAASLTWAVVAPFGPIGRPAPAERVQQAPIDAAQALAAFSRFDPFFRAAAGPAGAPDYAQIGLGLFAVRGGGRDGGAAIIQIPGRGQRSFSVGEDVLPGLKLQAVGADHVILAQGGAQHRLALPVATSGLATAPARDASGVAQPAGDATLRVAPTLNPAALMAELALQPRVENGEVKGYTIKEGAAGPMMARLGLRPGDTLLEVNNRRLVDDERVAEVQEELMSRPEAVIRYERAGQVKTAVVRAAAP